MTVALVAKRKEFKIINPKTHMIIEIQEQYKGNCYDRLYLAPSDLLKEKSMAVTPNNLLVRIDSWTKQFPSKPLEISVSRKYIGSSMSFKSIADKHDAVILDYYDPNWVNLQNFPGIRFCINPVGVIKISGCTDKDDLVCSIGKFTKSNAKKAIVNFSKGSSQNSSLPFPEDPLMHIYSPHFLVDDVEQEVGVMELVVEQFHNQFKSPWFSNKDVLNLIKETGLGFCPHKLALEGFTQYMSSLLQAGIIDDSFRAIFLLDNKENLGDAPLLGLEWRYIKKLTSSLPLIELNGFGGTLDDSVFTYYRSSERRNYALAYPIV